MCTLDDLSRLKAYNCGTRYLFIIKFDDALIDERKVVKYSTKNINALAEGNTFRRMMNLQ
jgi:hypothetical protein